LRSVRVIAQNRVDVANDRLGCVAMELESGHVAITVTVAETSALQEVVCEVAVLNGCPQARVWLPRKLPLAGGGKDEGAGLGEVGITEGGAKPIYRPADTTDKR